MPHIHPVLVYAARQVVERSLALILGTAAVGVPDNACDVVFPQLFLHMRDCRIHECIHGMEVMGPVRGNHYH